MEARGLSEQFSGFLKNTTHRYHFIPFEVTSILNGTYLSKRDMADSKFANPKGIWYSLPHVAFSEEYGDLKIWANYTNNPLHMFFLHADNSSTTITSFDNDPVELYNYLLATNGSKRDDSRLDRRWEEMNYLACEMIGGRPELCALEILADHWNSVDEIQQNYDIVNSLGMYSGLATDPLAPEKFCAAISKSAAFNPNDFIMNGEFYVDQSGGIDSDCANS